MQQATGIAGGRYPGAVAEQLADQAGPLLDGAWIEGRTPFLDRRLFDFASHLPDGLKVNLRFGVLLLAWLARADNRAARPYARSEGLVFRSEPGSMAAGVS